MKENSFSVKGFVVWFICALFFMYEFLLRTVIGTYQHQIMSDLHLSFFQFSLLSTTIFLLVYGLMQIPAGLLVDNFGLKKVMFVASLVCALACIGFAFSYRFEFALLNRLLMGFGASFGFICLLISVTNWMPHKYRAIFIGLSQFIGTVGPMGAAGPLAKISSTGGFTWNDIFLTLGVIGLVISALILFFVENNHQISGKFIVLAKPEKVFVRLKRLFFRSQPWMIAIYTACVYFSVEYLSENEGRIFLSLKGINHQVASNMLTLSWLGFAIACPLLGYLSDKFERRLPTMKFAALLALIGICLMVFSFDVFLLQCGFFLLGFGAGGQSIGCTLTSEQFSEHFVAVGFGLNNAVLMTLSAVNAPVIGVILDFVQKGAHLTVGEYISVFYILVGIGAISLVTALFFIKETYCKSAVDFTYLDPKVSSNKA